MSPTVDLAIVFRSGVKSKAEAADAAAQYTRLLNALASGGLKATGKRGATDNELLIFVWCPQSKLEQLAEHERRTDFVHGVSKAKIPSLATTGDPNAVTPAERIRLVHTYITSPTLDGGLGIAPGASYWTRVQSVMALQDRDFNHTWLSDWTRKQIGFTIPLAELDKIRDNFGEALALYFSFLSFYTRALFIPSIMGLTAWFLKAAYHPLYSIGLSLWAISTVDIWRVRERALAVRWGTYGVARVERRRVEFSSPTNQNNFEDDSPADDDILFPWWKRESRMAVSVPVIGLFGMMLGGLLTAIFLFEAFVTQLYTGPGKDYLSFVPTIIFVTVIPRIMAVYTTSANGLTHWENHAHESSFNRSLTLKTFALSSIVAFLGLFLTAFVYVPFGPDVMRWVNSALFESGHPDIVDAAHDAGVKPLSSPGIQAKINPGRLHSQMFAYTVTNQAINFFLETGLPFIMRAVTKATANKSLTGKKKTGDEKNDAATQLIEHAREESALPDYTLFGDYSEMVTQFGYIVIWSAAWPLAPLMALLNNWLELRSDAFKITMHDRRPLPQRVDTIGPWLEALSFITWIGALTNAALVYLFRPVTVGIHGRTTTAAQSGSPFLTTTLGREIKLPHLTGAPIGTNGTAGALGGKLGLTHATTTLLTAVLPALLTALAASHLFFVARAIIRHIVERAIWKGSEEYIALGKAEREVKRKYLAEGGAKGLVPGVASQGVTTNAIENGGEGDFWSGADEGEGVLTRLIKAE
ncbi:hypothetical protein RhiJN_16652 [Ceratobasidium sp. AG-Ba]|nr:hypothetical protein RhiJN_16652 [Ceratobasidium sp. AG-Ba]